jgi:uncharacterized protein YraI
MKGNPMRKRFIGLLVGLLINLLIVALPGAAQSGVRAVVVNDFINVRISPAIGASVITSVPAGTVFDVITGRSGDNQWLRVEYFCSEGWVNLVPLTILEGDIASLPVADPRSIPYGGFESPRSGFSQVAGSVNAIATDGLRVRAGPSTAYPTLTNINFNQGFTLTGKNACGSWYQVNFDNTLGWVAASYLQITGGDANALPIGGITAESAPLSEETSENYFATLRFMLDRLNIAQASLDQIRNSWTDAALNGRAVCQAYPARPTDFPIAQPLLAAYYERLFPLQRDFNDAMFNVRQSIDLFIEVCNQPGTANPVGQATVQGALNILNVAEQQFGSLRQRLLELIPDIGEVGPDECLLNYNAKLEVLPRIDVNVLYLDEFTRRTYARGYCFYAIEGQVLNFQTLPIPPADLEIFVSVSAIDTPTDFLTVSRGIGGTLQSIGPVIIPRTATYLMIIADLGGTDRLPVGRYAFRLADVSFGAAFATLKYDEATDSILLETVTSQPALAGTGTPGSVPAVCPSTAFTCAQLFTCGEAQACYQAGNFSLDPDGDGIPCEETLCTP